MQHEKHFGFRFPPPLSLPPTRSKNNHRTSHHHCHHRYIQLAQRCNIHAPTSECVRERADGNENDQLVNLRGGSPPSFPSHLFSFRCSTSLSFTLTLKNNTQKQKEGGGEL